MAKDSEILKAARERIKSRRDSLICFALSDCGEGTHSQRERLKGWVRVQLGSFSLYSAWVRAHHFVKWGEMYKHPDAFRAGRLAWLDWMIAECEKKEKP